MALKLDHNVQYLNDLNTEHQFDDQMTFKILTSSQPDLFRPFEYQVIPELDYYYMSITLWYNDYLFQSHGSYQFHCAPSSLHNIM